MRKKIEVTWWLCQWIFLESDRHNALIMFFTQDLTQRTLMVIVRSMAQYNKIFGKNSIYFIPDELLMEMRADIREHFEFLPKKSSLPMVTLEDPMANYFLAMVNCDATCELEVQVDESEEEGIPLSVEDQIDPNDPPCLGENRDCYKCDDYCRCNAPGKRPPT